jgi:hypothetical protein
VSAQRHCFLILHGNCYLIDRQQGLDSAAAMDGAW